MDKKILQTLSAIISRMPKKDLEKNLEKAKSVLKNSNKEDIEKMLSNPQMAKLLGKAAEKLKTQLENINLDELNTEELEKKLK